MIRFPGKSNSAAPHAVHELQAIAQKAAGKEPPRRRAMSRAARLQLIDILSRWASSGLAAIAGAAIFIAISAGGAYPFRAAVWAILVLTALYPCRRMLRDFRSGARSAARPFRWRSNYTASLSVLGAAFGAGAVIAIPAGAPSQLVFQSFSLMMAASLAASVLHAAHGRSAAAIFLPATVFVFLGAVRDVGPSLAISWAAAVAISGGAAVFLFNRFLRQRAMRRFPRTRLARRSASAGREDAGEFGTPEAAHA